MSFGNDLFMCKIIRYESGFLVKIMHLSQLFFHMQTLKALMKPNVTDC